MEDIHCTPSRKTIISWVKTLPSVSTLKPNSSYWTSGCSEGSFCKDNQMKCISLVADLLTSVNQSDVSLTWGEVAFYLSCIIAWYLIFGCFVVYMSILFLISKSLFVLFLFTSNQSNTCLHIYKHMKSYPLTWWYLAKMSWGHMLGVRAENGPPGAGV